MPNYIVRKVVMIAAVTDIKGITTNIFNDTMIEGTVPSP